MWYLWARKILFLFNAERAHHLGLKAVKWAHKLGVLNLLVPKVSSNKAVRVMGLDFPNRIGLAAGLDKNADYIDGLAALGFGFVEVGTVTPLAQAGNPKPRLFRLPAAEGIINRMGFNNAGVMHLVARVRAAKTTAIIGINIGKNKDTSAEKALDDYLICLRQVYAAADYVTINISSPNTPGLRDLQFGASLNTLLSGLKIEQALLAAQHEKYVPMAVKIAPDLTRDEVDELAAAFRKYEIDAVIATNTTASRVGVENHPHGNEAGGLSGAPVFKASTAIVRQFHQALPPEIPIIAAGGVLSGEQAAEKIAAGASLVQVYSGFIYRGPALISECVAATSD